MRTFLATKSFFLAVLGFELRAWATPPVHFTLVILEMGSHELLPILAFQVARISGASHWCSRKC
jgi:hypothetical protein